MTNFKKLMIANNKFLLIFLIIFLLSILNSIYQIKNFDNFDNSTNKSHHSMIYGDIEDFWREGFFISEDLKKNISYFNTGGEYRRPYLPSRIYALYSLIFNKKIYDEKDKVIIGFHKIIILFTQTIIYFLLLFFLYKELLLIFNKLQSRFTILFLSLEPSLFMYHSSFWSESFFFSLQIALLILLLKKNNSFFYYCTVGFLLGVLYLQRSVAIFYFVPILIFFFIKEKKFFLKSTILILISYFAIHIFIGYHNHVRMGIFYTISTQAKDGFYIYLAPNIVSKNLNISNEKSFEILNNKKNKWAKDNNLNLSNESDRLLFYDFQKKEALRIFFENPLNSILVILNKSKHFLVLDPITHVYNFHRWDYRNGLYYKSDEHFKWIVPRIIYSTIVYLICLIGLYQLFKVKKYRPYLFLILSSIIYFFTVQSWYGGTRYYAPILIYLSFIFAHGIYFLYIRFFNLKYDSY